MRAIATRDTAIERLAALLTQAGFTFRVQEASLPGRPDFLLSDYRCVIFTHGCFWHHHHCYLFKVPATRTDFWLKRLALTCSAIAATGDVVSTRLAGAYCLGVRAPRAAEIKR